MTDPLARDYSNSAAVLVGSWTYEFLPTVPAAQNSLKRMESLLTGPLCGWPQDRVQVFGDERDLERLNLEIAQRFEPVRDVALFYYVGHGQPDAQDQLCLSLPATRTEANLRRITSLGFHDVRTALNYSRAQTKIVILDCCFSGLAAHPEGTLSTATTPSTADLLTMTGGTGAIVLTASGAYNTAWFEQGEAHPEPLTYFTRYLAETVENGIPGRPAHLTLDHIYTAVADALQRDSLPSPSSNVRDRAGNFAFARNASPQSVASPSQDAEAARRLLADVEQQTLKMLEDRFEAAKRDVEEFRLAQAQRAAEHAMLLGAGSVGPTLPTVTRLLELLGMPEPSVDAVLERWEAADAAGVRSGPDALDASVGSDASASSAAFTPSLRAMIGAGHDAPFAIDLVRDGPHALIAGALDSGLGQLLVTVVTSLALANPPTNLSFLFIDQGLGSALGECADLPHVADVLTDLDRHQAGRLLASLDAELERRAIHLAEYGAKDFEDFEGLRNSNPTIRPLPRLVAVVDGFERLESDLPDLVAGLTRIAARGRALGVHLLLATRAPARPSSSEIRGLADLRIALRLADDAESQAVLGLPDAAGILRSTPGRAYARVKDGTLTSFQTGVLGTEADDDNLLPLVAVTRAAADRRDDPPAQPVVPPELLTTVELFGLLPYEGLTERGEFVPVPFGLEDRPDQQAQVPAFLDFTEIRHLLITGAPGSGRTQALLTIAAALAYTHSVADVHLYAIDCGTAQLMSLAYLPHCGAAVSHVAKDRVVRLLARLRREIDDRQRALVERSQHSEAGAEADGPGGRRPRIILMLDQWETFQSAFEDVDFGLPLNTISALMTDGAPVGVHVVIAGDRGVMFRRVATLAGEQLVLRLADRQDYGNVGIDHRALPDEIPNGRAFRTSNGREVQIAVLAPGTSPEAQRRAVTAIGDAARGRDLAVDKASRPFRVDALPDRVSYEEAWRLRDRTHEGSRGWALVGVGGDELIGLGPDMLEGLPAFVVAGPRRSGRSTLLMTMARSLADQGSHVIRIAPQSSPLERMPDLRDSPLFSGCPEPSAVLDALIAAPAGLPAMLIVDDAEMLLEAEVGSKVFEGVASAKTFRGGLIFAGLADELSGKYRGWSVRAQQAKRGALLSPQDALHGDLIGLRLRRNQVGQLIQPGRAVLHLGDGVAHTVQVPTDWAAPSEQ